MLRTELAHSRRSGGICAKERIKLFTAKCFHLCSRISPHLWNRKGQYDFSHLNHWPKVTIYKWQSQNLYLGFLTHDSRIPPNAQYYLKIGLGTVENRAIYQGFRKREGKRRSAFPQGWDKGGDEGEMVSYSLAHPSCELVGKILSFIWMKCSYLWDGGLWNLSSQSLSAWNTLLIETVKWNFR